MRFVSNRTLQAANHSTTWEVIIDVKLYCGIILLQIFNVIFSSHDTLASALEILIITVSFLLENVFLHTTVCLNLDYN